MTSKNLPLSLVVLASTLASPFAHSDWTYSMSIDPITDQTLQMLSSKGENGHGTLTVFCMGQDAHLKVTTKDLFVTGKYGDVSVITRVDKHEPIERDWLADSGTANSAFTTKPENWLVASMKRGNRLVLRITDDNLNRITQFYDLAGVTSGMANLDCNPPQGARGTPPTTPKEEPHPDHEEAVKKQIEEQLGDKLKGLFKK